MAEIGMGIQKKHKNWYCSCQWLHNNKIDNSNAKSQEFYRFVGIRYTLATCESLADATHAYKDRQKFTDSVLSLNNILSFTHFFPFSLDFIECYFFSSIKSTIHFSQEETFQWWKLKQSDSPDTDSNFSSYLMKKWKWIGCVLLNMYLNINIWYLMNNNQQLKLIQFTSSIRMNTFVKLSSILF